MVLLLTAVCVMDEWPSEEFMMKLAISKWKQEYADLKEQRDTDYTKLKIADV